MKTAKDLIIPFSFEERRPILLEKFFYIPPRSPIGEKTFSLFEGPLPIRIEYCSGNGQWIVDKALEDPKSNWVAVEKKFPRAKKIWERLQKNALSNLMVVCADAITFTRHFAPTSCPNVIEAFMNFPDPWPKNCHAKHRLISQEFLDELLKIFPVGGKFTCVTDDLKYAMLVRKEFQGSGKWNCTLDSNEWPGYGSSYFKELWIKKGRNIHYISHERVC